MKKIIFSCFIALILNESTLNAQVTNTSNLSTINPEFLGWNNAGISKILEIRNNFTNQPITFFTSNGTPTERMRLTQTGLLGLGTAAPVSLFHLNSTTATAIHGRFTNSSTGATATDGTRFGIETNGEFRLTQFENKNTDIWTPNLALSTPIQRFRIQSNGQVYQLNLGI